jgi:DNA polymerase-3 subunit epsilon/CBS domain-containing protein
MAKNPQWRGSQAQWRQRVEHWISRAAPEDLLSVDIFFDLRIAHGDAVLADRLWCHAFETARGQTGFAKQLIAAIGDRPPGRTWYGGLRTEHGRIDLKRAGLFGIVSVARALAVCHHVVERSTPARLAGLMALKLGLESDLDALTDAQGAMLDLMLVQQVDDITHGRPASNAVEVKRLSQRERARLKGALQAVENLDAIARDLLFRG